MLQRLLSVALLAALSPSASLAQTLVPVPLAEGRPCVFQDIVGLWETVSINAAERGATEHYAAFPRDYLRFKADGDFIYFGTNRAVANTADIQSSLDRADSVDGVTYRAEVRPDGALVIFRDEVPFQGFTCTISSKDQPSSAAPVMIWTELQGMPPVRRIQARLK